MAIKYLNPSSTSKIKENPFSTNEIQYKDFEFTTEEKTKKAVVIKNAKRLQVDTNLADYVSGKTNHITKAYIGSNTKEIANSCFKDEQKLKLVKSLDNSITDIEDNAFNNCVSLISAEFGNKLNRIGNNAFTNCQCLQYIPLVNNISYIGNECFKNCISLSSINIPNSLTAIADSCFENCISLKSLHIPGNVQFIGDNSFSNDSKLEKAYIPLNVKHIGLNAFSHCVSLSNLYYGDKNSEIWNSIDLSNDTVPELIENSQFNELPSNWTILVPPYMYWTFLDDSSWGIFGNKKWQPDYPAFKFDDPNYKYATHIITTFIPKHNEATDIYDIIMNRSSTYLLETEDTDVDIFEISKQNYDNSSMMNVMVAKVLGRENLKEPEDLDIIVDPTKSYIVLDDKSRQVDVENMSKTSIESGPMKLCVAKINGVHNLIDGSHHDEEIPPIVNKGIYFTTHDNDINLTAIKQSDKTDDLKITILKADK